MTRSSCPRRNAADCKAGTRQAGFLAHGPDQDRPRRRAGRCGRPRTSIPSSSISRTIDSRDEDRINPDKLRRTLASLNRLRKPREVHAAILGYLKNQAYHRVATEPWMYEALGAGDQDERGIRRRRQEGAQLRRRPRPARRTTPTIWSASPTGCSWKGYFERVGPLLDEAMPKIPHRVDPIIMSINLAQKTKDPVTNGRFRRSPALAGLARPRRVFPHRGGKSGRPDGQTASCREQECRSRLAREEARRIVSRDVFVRLSWDGYADFDLSRRGAVRRDRRTTICRAPSSVGR